MQMKWVSKVCGNRGCVWMKWMGKKRVAVGCKK